MEKTNEREKKFRQGDSGPKYLIQGPKWEGGIVVFKPGEKLGAHYHNEVEETFYFLEGSCKIYVNDVEYQANPGDVFRLEPKEKHDIHNNTTEIVKAVFIKCPYLPTDKIKA
ncbi:MAG: cupin domain-containing protein [Elusimicrobiota bacterium]